MAGVGGANALSRATSRPQARPWAALVAASASAIAPQTPTSSRREGGTMNRQLSPLRAPATGWNRCTAARWRRRSLARNSASPSAARGPCARSVSLDQAITFASTSCGLSVASSASIPRPLRGSAHRVESEPAGSLRAGHRSGRRRERHAPSAAGTLSTGDFSGSRDVTDLAAAVRRAAFPSMSCRSSLQAGTGCRPSHGVSARKRDHALSLRFAQRLGSARRRGRSRTPSRRRSKQRRHAPPRAGLPTFPRQGHRDGMYSSGASVPSG